MQGGEFRSFQRHTIYEISTVRQISIKLKIFFPILKMKKIIIIAFVLAKAGLLEGKESMTFPSDIPRYRETFPHLVVHEGVSFVHDGKLITSVGGAKSYDPALYLAEMLYGKKAAEGIGRGLVIDWSLSEIPHIKVD